MAKSLPHPHVVQRNPKFFLRSLSANVGESVHETTASFSPWIFMAWRLVPYRLVPTKTRSTSPWLAVYHNPYLFYHQAITHHPIGLYIIKVLSFHTAVVSLSEHPVPQFQFVCVSVCLCISWLPPSQINPRGCHVKMWQKVMGPFGGGIFIEGAQITLRVLWGFIVWPHFLFSLFPVLGGTVICWLPVSQGK